ncbi:hypothetical protein DXG03_007104 [Asterophora parasitica]|uniref:Transmembrane protein n=1 Tax=Asterophora parasitica TaxID=117018 RepID=A0A9P7GCM2_9AGAR|nr:hypothetical protein DXG03_007104 [Asterophora parasitica]
MPDLRYNIRWVESTFSSLATTESLLAPERDAGTISSNDYTAATNFLPGFHRHYRDVGTFAAIPFLYAVRRRNWGLPRTALFLLPVSFVGFVAGHVASITAHYNFVRSIEDPEGFSQAMLNIQKHTGSYPPPGPTIVRQGGKWAVDHDADTPPIHTLEQHTSPMPSMISDASAPSSSLAATPPAPPSKWDQIRAVNSRTSTNSSWDALRQNHERTRVPASNMNSLNDGGASDFDRTRGDDRAAEQAKFDELLEKERNMK